MKIIFIIILIFCLRFASIAQIRVDSTKVYALDSAALVVGKAWIINVQGYVHDEEKKPLEGVIVTYRSRRGLFKSITDAKGKFSLDSISPKVGMVRFTKSGYESFTMKITSPTAVYVTMYIDPNGPLFEYKIGYGVTTKLKSTGPSQTISGNKLRSYGSDTKTAIKYAFVGYIRGQDAYYVIDGFGGKDPDLVNINDIAVVTVSKSISDGMIYGIEARGKNVVFITTKRMIK